MHRTKRDAVLVHTYGSTILPKYNSVRCPFVNGGPSFSRTEDRRSSRYLKFSNDMPGLGRPRAIDSPKTMLCRTNSSSR